MSDLRTKIWELELEAPILSAAGTVGHGDELRIIDAPSIFKEVGAFVTKGITLKPRAGNPPMRLVETNYGLINAIGLQNNGVDYFFREELPKLRKYGIPIIVNIAAETVEEFENLAKRIRTKPSDLYQGIEINVSCPNIKRGGIAFGVDPELVEEVVKKVRKHLGDKLIITKLTPNVTDIVEIGKAAIKGGSNALSMINTVRGMAIDIYSRKPFLSNKFGGLSGPAIKPIGVLAVYECYEGIKECNTQKIPIIGLGGIMTAADALEYIMAGATAVGIGTGFYYSFNIFSDIKKGIAEYLERERKKLTELIGIVHNP
ncbi:MAG: dihydroorotate dehydrogenase [Spirochaetota bacterium]